MRVKQFKLIVVFPTTTSAMVMEKICVEQRVPGRLIPVPREITTGCGMAWCAPIEERGAIEQAAKGAGIETSGYYEMMI